MMGAPHFGFVVAAYALAALVVVGMIASILWDYRTLSAALGPLEAARGGKAPSDALSRLESGPDPGLVGIGGWLALPAIGLVLGPLVQFGFLILALTQFSEVERAGYGGVYSLELLVNAGLLAFFIYVGTRFFRKKRDAPSAFIAYMLATLVSGGALLAIESGLGAEAFAIENGKELARNIIVAAIWISYFRVSKRVKMTFVN